MNSVLLLILTFWKLVSSWFRMKAPNAKRMANASFAVIQIYFQFYTKGLSGRLRNQGEPCQLCFLESLFLGVIWNKLLLNNRHLERRGPINRRKIYIERRYEEDVWGLHRTHDFWNMYFCFPSDIDKSEALLKQFSENSDREYSAKSFFCLLLFKL